MINLTPIKLKEKLDKYLKNPNDFTIEKNPGMSEFEFFKYMKEINTKYSKSIDEQPSLRSIIDY
jgi:hypothetical protein